MKNELHGHEALRAQNIARLCEIRDAHETARVAAADEAADATRTIALAVLGGGEASFGDPRYAKPIETAVTALQRALRFELARAVCDQALAAAERGAS